MAFRLGYCCINMGLREQGITTNRNMIKRTWQARGLDYASELALANCRDLRTIIGWNADNGVELFRITSDLFPWSSEYFLDELPDYDEIASVLRDAGEFATMSGQRLSFHPGPFNVLASPRESVVEKAIHDLTTHGKVFDLMMQPRTPQAKINIHVGGAYGDRDAALERFCRGVERLPDCARSRLTVENDDRGNLYSVKDLYEGVYKRVGIPIVFDYHHHQFRTGDMTEEEALRLAASTWPEGITPCCHYAESKVLEEGGSIPTPAHSFHVEGPIDDYGLDLDIMLEAKGKELALERYNRGACHI